MPSLGGGEACRRFWTCKPFQPCSLHALGEEDSPQCWPSMAVLGSAAGGGLSQRVWSLDFAPSCPLIFQAEGGTREQDRGGAGGPRRSPSPQRGRAHCQQWGRGVLSGLGPCPPRGSTITGGPRLPCAMPIAQPELGRLASHRRSGDAGGAHPWEGTPPGAPPASSIPPSLCVAGGQCHGRGAVAEPRRGHHAAAADAGLGDGGHPHLPLR